MIQTVRINTRRVLQKTWF